MQQDSLTKAAYLGSLAGGVAGNIVGDNISNSTGTQTVIGWVNADQTYGTAGANLTGAALDAYVALMQSLYALYAYQLSTE